MKDDEKDIYDEIKRCTRCGLCIQNCPIYDILKDENNTSRGLITKLLGYHRKELDEKALKRDLKICLNCSKCKNNCPTGINTTNIFNHKNAYFSPSKFSQRVLLGAKLLPIKLLYFLNFFKRNKIQSKKSDTLYFKGCVAKAQHKYTYLDSIYEVKDNLCCGLPYLTSGDIKNYNKVKEKNLELIRSAKSVIFDCASCKSAIEEYPELDESDKNKFIFIGQNAHYRLKPNSKYKNKVITFHKPCHMDINDFKKIEELLDNIDGLIYKPLENPEKCCGFGGSYFMFHPFITHKIASKKADDIRNTRADLILSACPSCVIGLRIEQILSLNFKKTLELRDFIDKELELL